MPRYSDPIRQAEYIKKLRESHKGKLTGDKNPAKRPEVRAILSTKGKGRKRLDITGENNPAKRLDVKKKIKDSPGNQRTRFKPGQIPHNKGMTSKTYEPTRRDVEKRKGVKRTEEQKEHIRENLPSDHAKKSKEKLFQNVKLGKWGRYSKHEEDFESILLELGLLKGKDYLRQYRVEDSLFDFFLVKEKLIIETDGIDHVRNKTTRENDSRKVEILRKNGLQIFRVSDFDIYNNRDQVKAWIKNFINFDEDKGTIEAYCPTCEKLCLVTDIFVVDYVQGIYRGLDSNLHLVEFASFFVKENDPVL